MADGITYRGSSHLGQPSLEEPEYQEEPNEAMEIWGKTPEANDLEPMDNAYLVLMECWQAAEDARAKKASEAAWAARRVLA